MSRQPQRTPARPPDKAEKKKLIYYFNSRSKWLPFVFSCFTIFVECQVINDASFRTNPPTFPPPAPQLHHIMRNHGVVNRFSNVASIGIFALPSLALGLFRFLSVLRHRVTQFPCCWTNLVSVHKFMCTIRAKQRLVAFVFLYNCLWLCALRFVVIYCILLGGFSYFVQLFILLFFLFFLEVDILFLVSYTHWVGKRQGLKWLPSVCLAFDLVFVVI